MPCLRPQSPDLYATLDFVLTAARQPKWIARIVWMVGLITALSALSPAIEVRFAMVNKMVPPVFPVTATIGALTSGILLILLARPLKRGKQRAWTIAVILTALATFFHVIKGIDVEEAVLTGLVLVLLLSSRSNFVARADPRSTKRLLATVFLMPWFTIMAGWLLLTLRDRYQAPGSTSWERVQEAALGLIGIDGPLEFVGQRHQDLTSLGLLLLGFGLIVVPILLVVSQPSGGPHPLTDEEQLKLRNILQKWGKIDSLSYFALRDDRSVIFNKSQKAALTYRVVGTVSLAAGDPVGDPEAWPGVIETWLAEAKSYGWTPAVLGASEAGAAAFHRAGMETLELGDEAIIRVADFTLEGREMRGIRQAVSRCQRAGLSVTCTRLGDIIEDDRVELRAKADEWRDGAVERGFSMALNRFGEDRDDQCVVVQTRNDAGELVGLLNFVPWGTEGLSLDLMRRAHDTENGVMEFMVAELWKACPSLGIKELSLNFAVLRYVFERGERLGAGPVLRLWRAVLIWLSRFWQIESLYRANAKYRPEWLPRFLCFVNVGDLPTVSTAALRAEAFLVAPDWLQRLRSRPVSPATTDQKARPTPLDQASP